MSDIGIQRVGPIAAGTGTSTPFRADATSAQVVTDAHGRFTEAAVRGLLFSGGMTATAVNNATFTSGTLGATCTPIIGLYNPVNSPVNLVVLQATLSLVTTAATATGTGPLVWATSVGNNVITTGNNPLNRKTLVPSGAYAKDMCGVALTGLTTNLAVRNGSALGGGSLGSFSFVGTAVGQATPQIASVENLDGSLIVPPGGVIALLATTTPVAHTASSSILWEELPINPA